VRNHRRGAYSTRPVKRTPGKNDRSTGSGCGPANADRVLPHCPPAKDFPELVPFLIDVPAEINAAISGGENVLLEGTQGFAFTLLWDISVRASKDTSASQIAADNGVGPTKIDEVIVCSKAYPTRVEKALLNRDAHARNLNLLASRNLAP